MRSVIRASLVGVLAVSAVALSSQMSAWANPVHPAAATPSATISGTPRVGSTLICTVSPATTRIRWYFSSSSTVLENTATWELPYQALGREIVCGTATARSAPVTVLPGLFTNSTKPTMTGASATHVAVLGKVLTAQPGVWQPEGAATFSYVWKRGATVVSRAATYKSVALDLGKALVLTTTATRLGFTTLHASSLPVTVKGAFTVLAPVSMAGLTGPTQASPGKALTASTFSFSPTPTSYKYVWSLIDSSHLNGVVVWSGTTAAYATYTPQAADRGKLVKLTVYAYKANYVTKSSTSARAGIS
ncbi:MAG: hypothetical protein WCI29_02845 [Actinomycetes bacterium]